MRIMEHYGFGRTTEVVVRYSTSSYSGLAFGELTVFISDIEFPYRFSYEKERIFSQTYPLCQLVLYKKLLPLV